MAGRWQGTATAAVLTAAVLVGCHAGGDSTAARTPPAAQHPGKITVLASDKRACRALYARLQQVTVALDEISQLIAQSLDPRQLSARITADQQVLEQSAQLMAAPPIPDALAATDTQLVRALHVYAADFTRAAQPAARGDFRTAVDAMTDERAVRQILSASRTIENACR